MDSNQEMILKELTNFEKNSDEIEEIPEILDKYLDNVARSGDIVFTWDQFRPLIKKKIQIVTSDFNKNHPCDPNLSQPNVKPFDFEEVKRNILSCIDSFSGAPFTIQRICELLINPNKHYKRADKFMKGLEKNVMVISEETVDLKTENGNSSNNSVCLNSTFTLPSTSDSMNSQLTAFHNGYKENQNDEHQILSQQTASTIQQLDSFTTVFVTSQTTTHLDRIANLPILESTNHSSSQLATCLASSSSSITITPIDAPLSSGPALDSLEKMTTELPIIEPTISHQQLTSDIIIETVNSEEEPIPLNTSSLESNNDKIVLIQEIEEEDKYSDQGSDKLGALNRVNSISIEIIKEDSELNEQEKKVSDKDELNSEVCVNVSPVDVSPVEAHKKDQLEITNTTSSSSDSFESPIIEEKESVDLKRTHEEDYEENADESFKRLKTNNETDEKSIDEKFVEKCSVDNLMNENLDELKSEIKSELELEIEPKIDLEKKSEIKTEMNSEMKTEIESEKNELDDKKNEELEKESIHSNSLEEQIEPEKTAENELDEKIEVTNKSEELLNDKVMNELKSESNLDDKQEKIIDTN